MKLLALALCLSLCSCTTWNAQTGTFYTMGDSTAFKADYRNGKMTHIEWATNLHTPVTKAHWHGLGVLAADAVSFAAGPVPGVAVTGATQILNRPTSRPASPVIIPKP